MDKIKFGQFLIRERKKLNLNQSEFADMLDVSRQTVSKWENGETLPDLGSFSLLCEKLGLNADELLNMNHDEKLLPKDKIINDLSEKNKIAIKKKNIFLFISVFFLFLFFIVSIWFYFFRNNTLNKNIDIYSVQSSNLDIFLTKGIIVKNSERIYFNLYFEVNDLSDLDSLVYLTSDNEYKLISKISDNSNLFLLDNGYQLFDSSDVNYILENLYVAVINGDETSYYHLSTYLDYSSYSDYFNSDNIYAETNYL